MLRTLFAAAALVALMALPFGATLDAQEIPLSVGSTHSGSLTAGDTVRFTFEAGDDYLVRGAVDQISVDVILRILRPDGRVLTTMDGPAEGPERFQFDTDAEGRWQIQVIPFEEGAGDYTMKLEMLEALATDPEKLADQLLSAYDGEDSPGVAVSVFRDGETLFAKAYGMANLTYGIPFEVDTRTNIGSTSKQFTAFSILLLAEQGKLSLDDDVRTHIPELPDLGQTVTIKNILTHTSGYREFLNLLIMSGRRLDHGDFIERAEIIDMVQRQPTLQNAPGSEFNYNNTAFALAAVIVERVSGLDFPDFVAQNVFQPLGMTRSLVRPSPEHMVEGRAEGYTPGPGGVFLELGDLGGAMGAGGIYTTVEDLQKWIGNYAHPTVGSPEIVQQMMTRNVLTTGDTTDYGLGLFIDEHRGLQRVHHGGADVAHRSQLAYYPEINAGVTTQSNHAAFDGSIAFRLAEAFFGAEMEPEEVGEGAAAEGEAYDPATYDAEDFDELAGRYALDEAPTFILNFFREGDTLLTQATGQGRVEIIPTSDSTFTLLGVEASLTFHRNEEGEVHALTLHQNGDHPATRLTEEAEAWEPGPEALAEFTGRYFGEEVETFYTVTLEEDHLVLQQRRLDDADMTPGEEDQFTGGGFQISFERDRNGQVIAFYLANGRTRDVRFEKVR